MCRATADGGRRCSGHSNVSRNRAGNRAQWAIRASRSDPRHPTDLTKAAVGDDAPTIAESQRAVRLSPRLRSELAVLIPMLTQMQQQRAKVRDAMWAAEDALGRIQAEGTPAEIEAAEIALGKAELNDQRAARALAAWCLRNGGFLSPESMYKTLCLASPAGVPAPR
jgi:hypothetical protein